MSCCCLCGNSCICCCYQEGENELALANLQPSITVKYIRKGEQRYLDLEVACHFGIASPCGRYQQGDRWYFKAFNAFIFRHNDGLVHLWHSPTDEDKSVTLQFDSSSNSNFGTDINTSDRPLAMSGSYSVNNKTSSLYKHEHFKTTYEIWHPNYGFPHPLDVYSTLLKDEKGAPLPYKIGHRWVFELANYINGRKEMPSFPALDEFQRVNWEEVPNEALCNKLKTFSIRYEILPPSNDSVIEHQSNDSEFGFSVIVRNQGRKSFSRKGYKFYYRVYFRLRVHQNGFIEVLAKDAKPLIIISNRAPSAHIAQPIPGSSHDIEFVGALLCNPLEVHKIHV
jgi:hypothetical protein